MKPANLPEKVYVGPHVFDVVWERMEENYGDVNFETNAIRLTPGMAASRTLEVLVHEVTHALLYAASLPEDVEERAVVVLAPALIALIRDNPELVAAIESADQ